MLHLPRLQQQQPGQYSEPFAPAQLTGVLPRGLHNLPVVPKNLGPPPPTSSPPVLLTDNSHANANKVGNGSARKQLEEQFTSLKNSLNATCDFALSTLAHIEGPTSELWSQKPATVASQKDVDPISTPAPSPEPFPLHMPGMPDNHLSPPVAPESPTSGGHSAQGQQSTQPLTSTKHQMPPTKASKESTTVKMSVGPSILPQLSEKVRMSVGPAMLPQLSEKVAVPFGLSGITKAREAQAGAMKQGKKKLVGFKASIGDGTGSAVVEEMSSQKKKMDFQRQGQKDTRFMSVFKTQNKMKTRVFADAENMKDRVREAMSKPRYNVCNNYKSTGICQKIARSNYFENITLLVIALNSIWIGIEADLNPEVVLMEAAWQFQFGENFFCTYFVTEVVIRFCAFYRKLHAAQDPWFVFDSLLAIMMVLETWVMSIVWLASAQDSGNHPLGDAGILRLMRLLRLSRMARMYRLLRALPEVMILIKGMWVATRSVVFTLILLLVVIYIFAVAFAQLTADLPVGNEFFPSVLDAMKTLLLNGTFMENLPDVYYMCAAENELLGLLLLLYVLVGSLTVMNMLVGVLVEVVSVVAAVEKETLETTYVKQYLETLFHESEMDVNGENMINKDGFEMLLAHPDACSCLHSVGVDVVGLVDVADFILRGEDISFTDFVDLVLSLRGSNVARVKDIVDLRTYLTTELEHKAQLRDEANLGRLAHIEEMVRTGLTQTRTSSVPSSQYSSLRASHQ